MYNLNIWINEKIQFFFRTYIDFGGGGQNQHHQWSSQIHCKHFWFWYICFTTFQLLAISDPMSSDKLQGQWSLTTDIVNWGFLLPRDTAWCKNESSVWKCWTATWHWVSQEKYFWKPCFVYERRTCSSRWLWSYETTMMCSKVLYKIYLDVSGHQSIDFWVILGQVIWVASPLRTAEKNLL